MTAVQLLKDLLEVEGQVRLKQEEEALYDDGDAKKRQEQRKSLVKTWSSLEGDDDGDESGDAQRRREKTWMDWPLSLRRVLSTRDDRLHMESLLTCPSIRGYRVCDAGGDDDYLLYCGSCY